MLYQSFRIGFLYVYPIIASCRTVLRYQHHPQQQQQQQHQPNIPESTSGNSTPHRHQRQTNNNDTDPHDLEHWSLYWLISSLLTLLLERPTDALLLSWVPCYRWIKLLFYLWLALPRFQGAARLYYLIVHPWLTRHEVEIDAARGKAWEATKEGGRKLAVAAVSVATAAVAAAGEEGSEGGQGQRQGRAGGRGGGGLAALGGVSGLGGLRFVVSEAARVVLASLAARADGEGGGGGAAPAPAATVPQANNRQRRGRARHSANRQEVDDDERFERRVGNSSGEH